MSNQEETFMLNTTEMPADPTDSRFVGLIQDLGVERPQEQVVVEVPVDQAFHVNTKPRTIPQVQEPVSTFKPKVPIKATPAEVPKENVKLDEALDSYKKEELRILNNKIKDMEQAITLLVAGRDGLKLKSVAAEQKPIDWNKMKESDVFDMSIPIEALGAELPDYMKITLKDSNFVPRWVQKMSRRLGPMKAKGFTYVTSDEIEGELNIAIEPDENGVFRHDDVILMKIEKRRYYGMLRNNHQRALSMTNPKAAHQRAAQQVINDMKSGNTTTLPDGTGVPRENVKSGDFDKYADNSQGNAKLSVYAPGFEL